MKVRIIAAVLALGGAALAQTLTGTVTNATTGKPAAGDAVALLTLSQGMNETGSTKTDAAGRFSLPLGEANAMHLVRVTHQGVSYYPAGGPLRPGTNSVDIKVFDAAKKLDGVKATVDVMRMQAPDANTLQVIELIAVANASSPARTLGGERTWEVDLPDGAQIDQADAQGPGGMPVNAMPVADEKQKGRYYFGFPIRPGETRFQVAYHLPYGGQATLQPHVSGNVQHFAVMLPKSMQFGAHSDGVFAPMADESGQSNLQVASNVAPGKDLSFRVTGTGTLPDVREQARQGSQAPPSAEGGGSAAENRPGGGLGTPEGTPDALHQTRWVILGGLLGVLALGGMWVMSRSQGAARPATAPQAAIPATPASARDGSVLLQALKEELFQLEMERQQGKIPEAEYVKAKAALDQTLQRALARAKASGSVVG